MPTRRRAASLASLRPTSTLASSFVKFPPARRIRDRERRRTSLSARAPGNNIAAGVYEPSGGGGLRNQRGRDRAAAALATERGDRMTISRRLALASALALAGCVSTHDEPFSLDDGDAVSPDAAGYVCSSYDAAGKSVAEAHQARLIPLRRDKKTQYVFVDDETSSAEPFTLHRVAGSLYVVAVAHSDAPGEDLYVAQFADADKEFKLYVESDDFDARAPAVARERGVSLAHDRFSNELGGPVEEQKAFMVEMASDPKNWKISADCRAKR